VLEQPRTPKSFRKQERSGLVGLGLLDILELKQRQGSSVVEQGTHKPLVGSSNLPPGIISIAECRLRIADRSLNVRR
jgi:hypothetical protein